MNILYILLGASIGINIMQFFIWILTVYGIGKKSRGN